MPKQIRQTVLPLVAALIWGTAFVMQKGNTAGALTFNASRSLIAFLFLLPVIAGALILGERLTAREYAGCALMLCAVVLTQLPTGSLPKKKEQRA